MVLHSAFKTNILKSVANYHKEKSLHRSQSICEPLSSAVYPYKGNLVYGALKHNLTFPLMLSSDLSNLASFPSRFMTHWWCLEGFCKHNLCISYMIWDQLSLVEVIVWYLGYLSSRSCKTAHLIWYVPKTSDIIGGMLLGWSQRS